MTILIKFKKALELIIWAVLFRIRHPIRFIFSYIRIKRSGFFDIPFYEREKRRSVRRELDPVVHYLVFGAREGLSPHPLFDASYYRGRYPEVDDSRKDPFLHYLEQGSRAELSPHPLFDASYYRGRYPEVDDSGMDPFSHYLERGSRNGLSPHPLFDGKYYLRMYPDVEKAGVNPLIHYLLDGFREGCNPHPLFISSYYLERNRDVAETGINPLVHFVLLGCRERRNPHPLFDLGYYIEQQEDLRDQNPLIHYLSCGVHGDSNPSFVFHTRYYRKQMKAANVDQENPLIHYLEKGWLSGFDPNPLFSNDFYLKMYPDISTGLLNPLIHYLLHGGLEGRATSPLFDSNIYIKKFPDPGRSKMNPLVHYFQCGISEGAATTTIYSPSIVFSMSEQDPDSSFPLKSSGVSLSIGRDDIIPIFCVYGPQHVSFIKKIALAFFEKQQTTFRLSLHFVNYLSRENLLEGHKGKKTEIWDWSKEKEKEHMGFGESLNFLFRRIQPSKAFYIANPDSYPLSGCLQKMADTICTGGIGIVEARQWPYEHPKEYDPETGDTPWASGAFSLLSAEIFRKIDGFDDNFVLYAEDVDVSWRVWLEGARVVYQADALCCHLTGHPGYRQNRFYYEHFWSSVHFLVLAKKYFQETGEQSALKILRSSDFPHSFVSLVMEEYSKMRGSIRCLGETSHPMVRIWGLNLYHRLQKDAQAIGLKHRNRL